MKRFVAAACAAAFIMSAVAPAAYAQGAKPATPQQQRMKDCAAKWKEEKAKTGVKGLKAYRAFMKDCLKKTP